MIDIKDLEDKALELWNKAKDGNNIQGMVQALHFLTDISRALSPPASQPQVLAVQPDLFSSGCSGPGFVPEYHADGWHAPELEPMTAEPTTARHEYRAQAVAAKFPPFVK